MYNWKNNICFVHNCPAYVVYFMILPEGSADVVFVFRKFEMYWK